MQLRHPNRPRGLNFVYAKLDQIDQAMPSLLFDCVTASVSKLLQGSEIEFCTASPSILWTEKRYRRLFCSGGAPSPILSGVSSGRTGFVDSNG